MPHGLSVTFECFKAVSVMHTGLTSNFYTSTLLTEAVLCSSALILLKGEREEKGLELGKEEKHRDKVGWVCHH